MELNPAILLVITGILNAPAIVALVNNLLNKKKEKIEEEVTIGGEWQKYAIQAKKDKEEMQLQFDTLLTKLKNLEVEISGKNDKIRVLEESNIDLRGRVKALEKELDRYHAMEKKVDELKETAHVAVDAITQQVKEVINPNQIK